MFSVLRVSVFIVLLAAVVQAQDSLADGVVRGSTANLVGLGECDGWPAGGGETYKVYFTPDGVTFVPALGEDWPHDLPVQFQLLSVSRGEQQVALDAQAHPTPDASASTVRYPRAAGLIETWALGPQGAELSFELRDVPAGEGDLLVRLRLATELEAQADPLGEPGALGLLAVGPQGQSAGVRIGRVEGRDAAGLRATGALRLAGDVLELSLPDDFLRQARGPVVLDPLVGPAHDFSLTVSSKSGACAAFDATSKRWLVVWQRTFSATDNDVHAVRAETGGAVIGGLIFVENSTSDDIGPAVASINLSNRLLVAWLRSGKEYRGCMVNPSDGSVGPQGVLQPAHQFGSAPPVLGGNATLVDDRGLMAWLDDGKVWVASLHGPSSGPPLADPGVPVDSSNFPVTGLSASGGNTNSFLLAWLGPFSSLRVRLFDRFANTLIGTKEVVTGTVDKTPMSPHVDGDGSRFMVSYLLTNIAAAEVLALHCMRIEVNGSGFAPAPDVALQGENWYDSSVAWNGMSFQVAAVPLLAGGALPHGLYIGGFAPLAWFPTDPFSMVEAPGISSEARIASPTAGTGLAEETGLAVWTEFQSGGMNVSWMTVSSHGAGGSVTDLGGGCGSGGTLFTLGAPALGNPNFTFLVLGANPLATVIYLNVEFSGTQTSCGPCTYSPIFIVVALPASGGGAIAKLPLSAEPAWINFQAYVQGIIPTPGQSPCPSLPGVSLTNRLRILLQ